MCMDDNYIIHTERASCDEQTVGRDAAAAKRKENGEGKIDFCLRFPDWSSTALPVHKALSESSD